MPPHCMLFNGTNHHRYLEVLISFNGKQTQTLNSNDQNNYKTPFHCLLSEMGATVNHLVNILKE